MHVYEPKKMFGSGNLACYFSLKPDFFIHMYMYLKKKAFSVFLKPYIAPGYVNYKKGANIFLGSYTCMCKSVNHAHILNCYLIYILFSTVPDVRIRSKQENVQ
jgi:hypothetical protein